MAVHMPALLLIAGRLSIEVGPTRYSSANNDHSRLGVVLVAHGGFGPWFVASHINLRTSGSIEEVKHCSSRAMSSKNATDLTGYKMRRWRELQ